MKILHVSREKDFIMMLAYRIVGNSNYHLDSNLNVTKFFRNLPDLEETETEVCVSLYGMMPRWINKEWLKLLSIYNMDMPYGYEDRIYDIDFKPIAKNPYLPDEHYIYARVPIHHKEHIDFRMIPRFPRYFVNKDGIILDTKTGKFKEATITDTVLYPVVHIVDQSGIYSNTSLRVHRLVAYAWVYNTNPNLYYIVDHIDANKRNFHASNLRWCDCKANSNYAVELGLTGDNYPVLIRNIDTGEVTKHVSLTKACEYMGRSRINSIQTPLDKDKIWKGEKGRFEIKREDDKREWFYIEDTKNKRLSVNTFDIKVIIDNETKYYKSWRDIKVNLLDLQPEAALVKEDLIKRIKLKYPNAIVEFREKKGVVATDGDKIYRATSTKDMSKKIPVPKSTIIKYMALGKGYGKWKFKVDDGTDDFNHIPDGVDNHNTPRPIKVIDTLTKTSNIYNSIREVSKILNLDRASIYNALEYNSGIFKNYVLSYI